MKKVIKKVKKIYKKEGEQKALNYILISMDFSDYCKLNNLSGNENQPTTILKYCLGKK